MNVAIFRRPSADRAHPAALWNRRVEASTVMTATARIGWSFQQQRPGHKKPIAEGKSGDSLHRKSGLWMRLTRLIDRLNNGYVERVVNPATGEVVHECDEPLTDHQGHGDAKNRKGSR